MKGNILKTMTFQTSKPISTKGFCAQENKKIAYFKNLTKICPTERAIYLYYSLEKCIFDNIPESLTGLTYTKFKQNKFFIKKF